MCAVEQIPDPDHVSRLVEFPRTYERERALILDTIFEFPGGAGESLIWRKYAPNDEDVHRIGCDWEAFKRTKRPEMRYSGFLLAIVGLVRQIRTTRGHGFSVNHAPAEGVYHAEVIYLPAERLPFERSDKLELKFALKTAFGSVVPHECPQTE